MTSTESPAQYDPAARGAASSAWFAGLGVGVAVGGIVVASRGAPSALAGVGAVAACCAATAPLAWALRLGSAPSTRAALAGVGLAALACWRLGGWLAAATHHRPLGAVTFAVVAGVVLAGAAWIAASVSQRATGRALQLGFGLLGAAAAGLVVALGATAGGAVGGWWEALLGVGATAAVVALLPSLPAKRLPKRGGPVVWGVVTLVAVLLCLVEGAGVGQAAPTLSWPLRALIGQL